MSFRAWPKPLYARRCDSHLILVPERHDGHIVEHTMRQFSLQRRY